MKFFVQVVKIAAILILAGAAITILATLLGVIDTSLVAIFFVELSNINLPFDIFLRFPNVWIVIGYFVFKSLVVFGIDTLKKGSSNA